MTDFLKITITVFFLSINVVKAAPNIQARTAILVDYQSGKILFELQPDHSIHPASMTKIMTTIVVFDLLVNEKISLDDKVTISEKLVEKRADLIKGVASIRQIGTFFRAI